MKNQLKSKTVWFNVVSLLLFVIQVSTDALGSFGVDEALKLKIMAIAGIVMGIGNYILRVFFTKESIGSEGAA